MLDWENKYVRVDEEEAKWIVSWENCGMKRL